MKRFKILSVLLALVLGACLALTACGGEQGGGNENGSGSGSGNSEQTPSGGSGSGSGSSEQGGSGSGSGNTEQGGGSTTTPSGSVLVAYFSASGNTGRIAQYIAEATNADTFEITPVEPYTSADLSWTTQGSRVNNEHDNEALQDIALVQETPDGWDNYKTVFVGYPIWWQEASWVVNRFVKNNDFTGKTVIPFCTSSSSPLGESGTKLAAMAGMGNWLQGQRFQSGASKETVEAWIEDLDLDFSAEESPAGFPITEEAPGANALNGGPQSASRITSVEGVPLVTLNNGVEMPRFGLGTQIQDLENNPDLGPLNRTSRTSVIAALQAGYRHLDDAHGYRNERGVAQGIRDSGVPREELILTTKLWPTEFKYQKAKAQIDATLKRLDTDYIDIMLLHQQYGDVPGAWKALEEGVREGKIKTLGVSNFDEMHLIKLLANCTIPSHSIRREGASSRRRRWSQAHPPATPTRPRGKNTISSAGTPRQRAALNGIGTTP